MSAIDVPLPIAIARVHAPVAPMLAEPRVASGQVSQALHGHLLSVSERRDDWCRVHGLDGYAGWTHRGYLHVVDVTVDEPEQATPLPVDSADAFEVVLGIEFASAADARLVSVDDDTLRISLGCTVRDDGGRVRRLPLGAWLTDRDDRRVTHVGIATGDGRMAHLALGRGGWALDRLDDASDAYVATLMGRFLFARRV